VAIFHAFYASPTASLLCKSHRFAGEVKTLFYKGYFGEDGCTCMETMEAWKGMNIAKNA
jgi:hypothetical protein